jgi:hypothetical protein
MEVYSFNTTPRKDSLMLRINNPNYGGSCDSPSERFLAAAEAALRYLDDSELETLAFTLEAHVITTGFSRLESRSVQ